MCEQDFKVVSWRTAKGEGGLRGSYWLFIPWVALSVLQQKAAAISSAFDLFYAVQGMVLN